MHKRQQELQQKIARLNQAILIKDKETLQIYLDELEQSNKRSQQQELPSHQLYQQLNQILPLEKIRKYQQLKARLKKNQQIMRIVSKGQSITLAMDHLYNQTKHDVEQIYQIFNKVINSVDQFEQTALNISTNINFSTLREQLYLQMLGKLNTAIHNFEGLADHFKHIIESNSLPLKKDEVRKIGLREEERQVILYILYKQSCLTAIKRFLLGLLEKEEKSIEQSMLSYYWDPAAKILSYLFMNHTQLRNIEQPQWMFEYMQQILNANYKYLLQFICCKQLKKEIVNNTTRHFLQTTFHSLFTNLISKRFELDLPSLNQYLTYNFIEQLGKFQEKLSTSFGIRPKLVGILIYNFDDSHQILSKALSYEEKWFETKVFQDFINIDYSRVNLKNLDAFNIVTTFLSLFQKLYRKYVNVQEGKIKQKISTFYRKQILNLIAHIKTSFDRIYNYSKLPKIDVLLSFKRVENELRGSLSDFLATEPILQQSLDIQYYSFLQSYFEVCALEAVTPTHKKLHISLADIMNYLNSSQENDHQKYISSFKKIFDEWQNKIDQIIKFAPYSDNKVRSIFFKYLEATNFSLVGLNLYMKIFQPYLRILFTEDRHRTLLSLITMNKQAFYEYIQSHSAYLEFLNAEERKQLQSFKKRLNIQ